MSTQLEIETKFELDATGFERLRALGHQVRCVDQLNVYYDCDWRLAESSATFRVRFDSGRMPVLTIKIPISHDKGTRIMREYELPVRDCETWGQSRKRIDVRRQLPAEIGKVVISLGIEELFRVGWLRNRRYVVEFNGVGQIELDQLRLPTGWTVFEAEIDTDDDQAHRRLSALICTTVPSARPAILNKFQRFRQAVLELEGDSR